MDIIIGIVSLEGGVADGLLRAKGFLPGNVWPVPMESLDHEVRGYSVDALRAISAAIEYAASRSYTIVGIEDMLIGILTPPCTEIEEQFRTKNISPEELLTEVRSEL